MATPIVETSGGRLKGTQQGPIAVFRGIPYGDDTGGKHRFLPPRAASWQGVLKATNYGHRCPQNELPTNLPYLAWLQEMGPASENCLVLNVYTPTLDEGSRLPVMFYVHGGAFRISSGSTPGLDGSNLAKQGAVVVTVNHRLNLFGFLHLGSYDDERYADSCNVGMLDLVAALEWVKNNISRFGGDPGNVTLFGQSGGGSKVAVLMAMPRAQGLFHKAIIQSASSLLRMATLEEAQENTEIFLSQLGISSSNLHKLRELSNETLLEAMPLAIRAAGKIDNFRPVVDGRVLPSQPFEPQAIALSRHVPLITGWCENEMRYFHVPHPEIFRWDRQKALLGTAHSLAIDAADAEEVMRAYSSCRPRELPGELYSQILGDHRYRRSVTGAAELKLAGDAPVFMYLVNWKSPAHDGLLKAPHTLCIAFAFANVDVASGITGNGEGCYRLQAEISQAWLAFARSGNPNHRGLPRWHSYSAQQRHTMVFDLESGQQADPLSVERVSLAGFGRHVPAISEGASI